MCCIIFHFHKINRIIILSFLFRTLLRKSMVLTQLRHRLNWPEESGACVDLQPDRMGARIWAMFMYSPTRLTEMSIKKELDEYNKLFKLKKSSTSLERFFVRGVDRNG